MELCKVCDKFVPADAGQHLNLTADSQYFICHECSDQIWCAVELDMQRSKK